MFKRSFFLALLLAIMTISAFSEESVPAVEGTQEAPESKCDIQYDACIVQCGESPTEECSNKCEKAAEKCDEESKSVEE